ncbi:MAG: PAS domain S-box protein [Pseudomonadota bacterium]
MALTSNIPAPGLLTDADYRLMVDAVTDYAIFHLDPDGIVLSWNAGAKKLKGYEAPEVIGRHFSVFYPQELLDRGWPAHELQVAREVGRFEDEGWRLRKDGTRFWANIIITRLTGPDGTLRGFSKITRDLSERRRQDELLRLSEERFRLMVEGVQDYAIYMLDPSGHIVSWNAGAQKTKGYTATEIIGQHFSVFYPEEVAASGWPAEELRLALRDGRLEDEGWRVRKDGSRFWASVVITALHDASGRHRGFAKITRDLTDKKRTSLLEDEGRRITTFLAMLGHELRNPLAPISNALALMERETLESKPLRTARDIIGRQVRQMTRLVDDLLDIGRITSGKIHLESRLLRLGDAIAAAVEASGPAAQAKSQHLEVVADPGLWISGDQARIVQVICNLLNNAVKFTPPGSRIRLTLRRDGDTAELAIKDNGPGISATDLPRVFDLFAQGEQDTSRSLGGLGLGLSLVQQLVKLHAGEVAAYSTGIPGEGAEFVVRLPAVATPADGPQTAPDGTPQKSILVVDDSRDSADTMALLLDAMGYATDVAYDGPSAVEAARKKRFGVLLLDIGLPGLSGIEVARKITAEIPSPPEFIAITGYGQEADRQTSLDNGFFAHVTKPVDVTRLGELLERALERFAQRR